MWFGADIVSSTIIGEQKDLFTYYLIFYVTSVARIRLQRSSKKRKNSGRDWSPITLPVPVILRKYGAFVTSGAFNLPCQKNLVINLYLAVWDLGQNESSGWSASWQQKKRKHQKS